MIAIENTRLLNELRQSLESSRDLGGAEGDLKLAWRIGTGVQRHVGKRNAHCAPNSAPFSRSVRRDAWSSRQFAEERRRNPVFRPPPATTLGRALATKQPARSLMSWKAMRAASCSLNSRCPDSVSVPMLKDEEPVGAILIYRLEADPSPTNRSS